MQDDSSLNNGSARKSKIQRAQSAMTDSFRMAASVLGTTSTTKKSYTLTVPKLPLKEKQQYKKQPECQICFTIFGKFGQHHCRICANAVCSSCSFSTINKQRACDKCAYHFSDVEREKFKKETIKNLTELSVQYLINKYRAEESMKNLENQIPNEQTRAQQKKASEDKMRRQNDKLEQIAQQKRRLQVEIQRLRSS